MAWKDGVCENCGASGTKVKLHKVKNIANYNEMILCTKCAGQYELDAGGY